MNMPSIENEKFTIMLDKEMRRNI